MHELLSFFIIVFIGVFFSMVRRRLHLPWVVALILGGVIIGPYVFDIIDITPITTFLGEIGLIFLMFMAGLETRLSSFEGFKGKLLFLSFINAVIPFIGGVFLGTFFGYSLITSLLIGVIFIASSIAVVVPSLEVRNLLHTRLGQSVVMTSVIQDIASLLLLSLILQSSSDITWLPLYFFYPLVVIVIILIRYFLPKLQLFLTKTFQDSKDVFQQEFRSLFVVLLGTVVMFDFLGLHPIIGAFFTGFVLSESITSPLLKEKIRTISYGVFIPIFFVLIGVRMDIGIFSNGFEAVPLILTIVLVSIGTKLASGYVGARMVGFSADQSLLFSISSIAQMSTTLAVAFTAFSMGLLDEVLMTGMIILSVVSVLVSPTLMDVFGKRIKDAIPMKEKILTPKDPLKEELA